jgi:hypothetical protein
MIPTITLSHTLIIFGLFSFYSVSTSELVRYAISSDNISNNKLNISHYPDRASIQVPISSTQVDIVKSFKNSSGFYKIDGTLENKDAIIISDIQVTKYYKFPSVNDTTLICYEQKIANCQYKSIDSQLSSKSLFLNMPPPLPPEGTSLNPN